MMNKLKFLVLFCFTLAGYLLIPAASLAQSPSTLIIIYPAAEEKEGELSLAVFFYVVDNNGQPIKEANIESVQIELQNSQRDPFQADFQKANTPFYIAMLLDASGSMSNVMPDMKKAAQSALNSAPLNAKVGVFQFNEDLRPIVDFTDDLPLVSRNIDRIEPKGNTCLYDSLYEVIDKLSGKIQSPQERQAIILFTDGKDEMAGTGKPCSASVYDNVITKAKEKRKTPIHTIGLCSDEKCNNINKGELKGMATETFAFSIIGNQTDLSSAFGKIMDGLNSQWVARAKPVFARQGVNQAVLQVKLQGVDTPLSETFDFESSKDYDPPLPPVTAKITSVTEKDDIYNLALSIGSPSLIQKLIVEVWDTESGVMIEPSSEYENPKATLMAKRSLEGLEGSRKYSFKVKAVDIKGNYINKQVDGKVTDVIILDEKDFVPPQRAAVEFSIEAINPNLDAQQLIIELNLSSNNDQIESYSGLILDKDTGQSVYDITPELFKTTHVSAVGNRQILMALPEALQSSEAKSYLLKLTLTRKDNKQAVQEKEFKMIPLSWGQLITRTISNPYVYLPIIVIIFSVIATIIYINRPAPKPVIPETPRFSAIDVTMHAAPIRPPTAAHRVTATATKTPQLQIKVLQVVSGHTIHDKIVTKFPCDIGRNPSGDFVFPSNYPGVSNKHAQVVWDANQGFGVVDVKSTGGTFVGEVKLLPNGAPHYFKGSLKIRLANQTMLELIEIK